MELDKLKHIWKQQQAEAGADFNEEKIMKGLEQRIKGFQLHDKRKNTSLILGFVWLAIFILGIGLSLIKSNGDMGFFWLFGPASAFFFYQYAVFKQTPINNQPLPVYINHLLKRIKSQKIARVGLILSFIPIYWDIFMEDYKTPIFSEWTSSQFIGVGAMAFIFGFVMIAVRWYQRNFDTGSMLDLEKELRQLKTDLASKESVNF